eukprot:1407070-Pleurochrysis_carterae.AAC.5
MAAPASVALRRLAGGTHGHSVAPIVLRDYTMRQIPCALDLAPASFCPNVLDQAQKAIGGRWPTNNAGALHKSGLRHTRSHK